MKIRKIDGVTFFVTVTRKRKSGVIAVTPTRKEIRDIVLDKGLLKEEICLNETVNSLVRVFKLNPETVRKDIISILS